MAFCWLDTRQRLRVLRGSAVESNENWSNLTFGSASKFDENLYFFDWLTERWKASSTILKKSCNFL